MKCPRCQQRGWPALFKDEPKCAFEGDMPDLAPFNEDNWNCATMNALREVAEAGAVWSDDQWGALIPVGATGNMILLGWYKHRGRTEQARVMLSRGQMAPLTLATAEEALASFEVRAHTLAVDAVLEKKLEELRQRLADPNAFKRPWRAERFEIVCDDCGEEHTLDEVGAPDEYPGGQCVAQIIVPGLEQFSAANAALIVSAVNHAADLLDEIGRLRSLLRHGMNEGSKDMSNDDQIIASEDDQRAAHELKATIRSAISSVCPSEPRPIEEGIDEITEAICKRLTLSAEMMIDGVLAPRVPSSQRHVLRALLARREAELKRDQPSTATISDVQRILAMHGITSKPDLERELAELVETFKIDRNWSDMALYQSQQASGGLMVRLTALEEELTHTKAHLAREAASAAARDDAAARAEERSAATRDVLMKSLAEAREDAENARRETKAVRDAWDIERAGYDSACQAFQSQRSRAQAHAEKLGAELEEVKGHLFRAHAALVWTSGADVFQVGGDAHAGFNSLVRPVIDLLAPYVRELKAMGTEQGEGPARTGELEIPRTGQVEELEITVTALRHRVSRLEVAVGPQAKRRSRFTHVFERLRVLEDHLGEIDARLARGDEPIKTKEEEKLATIRTTIQTLKEVMELGPEIEKALETKKPDIGGGPG